MHPSDPGILRLLSTNDMPSAIQTTTVLARLAALTKEVEDLQRILSPLRRVPLDIIGEILVSAMEGIEMNLAGRERLLDLCLVCKAWRAAALQTHRLWGDVIVSATMLDKEAYGPLGTWIRRAGSTFKNVTLFTGCQVAETPGCLDIGFDDNGTPKQASWEAGKCGGMHPAVVGLFVHGPVPDRMVFFCESEDCVINLADRLKAFESHTNLLPQGSGGDAPMTTTSTSSWDILKSLHVRCSSEGRGGIKGLSDNLSVALTDFLLHTDDDVAYYTSLQVPPTTLHNLTCFSIAIDSAPVEFYVDVLRHCTNLETLTIEDPRELVWDFGNLSRPPLSPRSEDFAPAILPRLRTLVLTGAYVAELDFIRTPGLVNLHLKDLTAVDRLDPVRLFQPVGDTRALDASQLRSIGQQGHCTLRNLTLEDGTVDFRMLARGLLPLQSLEYLGMSGMRVDVEYLAMLIAEAVVEIKPVESGVRQAMWQ
ncbi:hypothetical protein DFP72DRAFT_1049492 [Ephemerocybe angulata]|uniref:F-box domain-containing protein n=1 Tax=Ephemerocybe angulata TaxID=980116 RepID=A0A8H6HLE7_9AGAR|nr:hypothetical protein DFP72DRAFT_1049492 [Tulosesus angulatus]